MIYVAFGSWVSFEGEQLVQIASALTPYSFIWSLKETSQVFLSNAGLNNQRHLLLDWAPQRFILSHPAVRLFVSHGGWNSLLEGMLVGKPILVWPFFADQTMNGYRVEYQLGIGQCMINTDLANDRKTVSSAELTRYLKGMFDQEATYLRNARQVQKIISHARENSSRRFFEEIIKTVDNQIGIHRKRHNEL